MIKITLNGTFNLTGSAADVANGVYTNQTGTMRLGSIISVTPVGGTKVSESSFLPDSEITLNFDGTLDFSDNNLTITDTSKVTVNYDSDNSGSVDTELKIYSQGNNSYISTKAVSGTITSIENVGTSADTTEPDITSASSYSVVEGTTAIATLTANEAVTWEKTGGADAAAFDISSSGELSFSFTPDYETPVDTGSNNTYEVKVTARDGNGQPSEEQTITVSVVNDATESPTSSLYEFERTTDLTDVDTGIGLFNKNVLINYLVTELSNNFGSLTSLSGYSTDLAGLEFDFETKSGSLDMSGFGETSLTITANNVCLLYTSPSPRDVSLSRMPSSA